MHFIVNPNARTSKGALVWEGLEKILKNKGCDYEVHLTAGPGHATKIAAKLCEENEKIDIIMVGGDGTADEIAQGIDASKATLGYIPVGSSNDLARGLNIGQEAEPALERILERKTEKEFDLGYIVNKEGVKRKFLVSSGFGFDAAICFDVQKNKMKNFLNKIHLGRLIYGLVAVKLIFTHKKTPMTIVVDGGEAKEYKDVLFAAAMNHPWEGGGVQFSPEADATDGMLDVCIAHDLSVLKTLRMIPGAYKGKHVNFTKNVEIIRCKSFNIKANKPQAVHTDGETPFYSEEVTFSTEEKVKFIL
ncbi:MAG: diacylglycerol kinase family lipid kinase [Lachnospiraceae bacterium]|nr:diacylglycerol kinase family lipid kinase [Lachnospiraceae bacterium]